MENNIKIELLTLMQEIRLVEETIARRYGEGKMRCPTHLCTGQEAVSAAVGTSLRRDDFVVSSHRAHGHYLAKGGSLKRMIAEIYGKATGCSKGKGGSMHLVDQDIGFIGSTAIVGGTIPVGVGLGLSIALHNTDQVSCIFFGDGAVEEGVFFESINFAALKKLPVLFICENNFFSVYSPLAVRQPKGRKITEVVEAMGIRSDSGDGNDAVAVYQKIQDALRDIRKSGEPRFFEFNTYRWREHCGPNCDDDLGYRSREELCVWKERDPVRMLEQKLLGEGIIDSVFIEHMNSMITQQVEDAFIFAEDSPFPEPEETFSDLFKQ